MSRPLGQLDEARHYYEQALTIACEVSARSGEGTALNNLGGLAANLGQPEQAQRYYEQALVIFQEIGAVASARVVARNLAHLDSHTTTAPSNNLPDAASPALPSEKTPQRKPRWPWQRRPAE